MTLGQTIGLSTSVLSVMTYSGSLSFTQDLLLEVLYAEMRGIELGLYACKTLFHSTKELRPFPWSLLDMISWLLLNPTIGPSISILSV